MNFLITVKNIVLTMPIVWRLAFALAKRNQDLSAVYADRADKYVWVNLLYPNAGYWERAAMRSNVQLDVFRRWERDVCR